MNVKENSVVGTGKTEDGGTNLAFHSHNEEKHLVPGDTTGTGYTKLLDNDSDDVFETSFESRWLITLQRWNTACRVVTFVFSLVAYCLIFFETRTTTVIEYKDIDDHGTYGTSGHFTFNCNDSFPIMFFKYINLAVCAYALLLLLVSAFVTGRKGTGVTTPASALWTAFVLNIIAVSVSLLAFAASLAVEVLNRIGRKKFCNTDYDEITCFRLGAFCEKLEPALAASLLAYASFVAGTCIDWYFIKRRSLATSPDVCSSKGVVDSI